jgi:hypothetical protein
MRRRVQAVQLLVTDGTGQGFECGIALFRNFFSNMNGKAFIDKLCENGKAFIDKLCDQLIAKR